jgi:cbb3-type cytochrome oxidase cytochrome c subunit
MKITIATIIAMSILVVACGKDAAPTAGAPKSDPKSAPDGKALFRSEGCTACHSAIAGGIEPEVKPGEDATGITDLSGLAEKHKAEWLKLYLRSQETLGERKHPTRLRKSGDELDALVAWLLSLPSAPANK